MSKVKISDSAPHWVKDNPLIQRVLTKFIDCCDKGQALKMFVRPTQTKELYNFDDDTEALWRLLVEKLHRKHAIINVDLKQNLASQALPYENARLTFNSSQETLVRDWLNRPKTVSLREQWQNALTHVSKDLPDPEAFYQPIYHPHKTAQQILSGFVKLAQILLEQQSLKQKISLRTLSARSFWGDSKFLDQRHAFIEHAYPLAQLWVEPRAIMMSAYIPQDLKYAVFIENFDSFRSTVKALLRSPFQHSVAVIYGAGYRASAKRIRQHGNSQFVTINHVSDSHYHTFTNWWYNLQDNSIPCLFWGDLDYEGMGILKALRSGFPNAVAWSETYQTLLWHHQAGLRHNDVDTQKQAQRDPLNTGCDYADKTLLPAMREADAFTDQEAVCENEILTAIEATFEQ